MGYPMMFALLCVSLVLWGGVDCEPNRKQLTGLYNELKTRVVTLEKELKQSRAHGAAVDKELAGLKIEMSVVAEDGQAVNNAENVLVSTPAPSAVTAIYTRWGRRVCDGADFVYEGIMGAPGNRFNGSGGNYLCLNPEPEWGTFIDGDDTTTAGRGVIYGVEYHGNPDEIFDNNNLIGTTFFEQNVPCAVCASYRRNKVMLPAQITCPGSWTMEYWGYLMSDNYETTGRTQYVCVDHAPEARDGGSQPQLETSNIYHVEARCGSLPCPPYIDNREITCVVCSK